MVQLKLTYGEKTGSEIEDSRRDLAGLWGLEPEWVRITGSNYSYLLFFPKEIQRASGDSDPRPLD